MSLPHNPNPPRFMHLDGNSFFASAEQQKFPLWRNKPIGVTPVNVPGGSVIAPSRELKKLGAKTGIKNRDARLLADGVVLKESSPTLYRQINREFKAILQDYSPDVYLLSIDEALIDLSGCPALKAKSMEDIAREIKARAYKEMGCWMSLSVGISTNAFLAKTAAGLDKPDGLRTIDHTNARSILTNLELADLCGIAQHNEARLNAAGVFTTEQFMEADAHFLSTQVFESIAGWQWFRKLRGYQDITLEKSWQKGFSASVQLGCGVSKPSTLLGVIYALTLRASTKLRRKGQGAQFIQLMIRYRDGRHFRAFKRLDHVLWSAPDAFRQVTLLFNQQHHKGQQAVKLIVDLSDAVEGAAEQLDLFSEAYLDLARRDPPKGLAPDAWFVGQVGLAAGGPPPVLVGLVEMDRGTERLPTRWREKLVGYTHLFSGERLRAITGYVNARVLVVTPDAARRDRLAEFIGQHASAGMRDRFWLADKSVLQNSDPRHAAWKQAGSALLRPLFPAIPKVPPP